MFAGKNQITFVAKFLVKNVNTFKTCDSLRQGRFEERRITWALQGDHQAEVD